MIIGVRSTADMRGVRAAETVFIVNNGDPLVRAVVLAILSSIDIAI